MTCFIIAAVTADGYIAENDAHSPFGWTSKEDKKRFIELTGKAGVVVMGSKTFKTLSRPLKDRLNIVYSRSQKFEGAETTQLAPHELLGELRDRGFKEIAVCGGSAIYTMFMKAGVVGKLYLTVEPLVFGSGLRLFNEGMRYSLKLKSSVRAENGALMLEYDVDYPVK